MDHAWITLRSPALRVFHIELEYNLERLYNLTIAYTLRILRTAKRKLQSLPAKDRYRITNAISLLGGNPDDTSLDTRPLEGSKLWRLRVGRWRVLYDRSDELRIISIEKIGPRGDVYK